MKIKALVLMLLAVVFASGCSLSKAPEGENLLQEGLSNLYYEAKSAKFDLSVKADVKAPEGQVPAQMNFDINLAGDMDNTKPAEPKFNITLSAKGGWDEVKDQTVEAEMKSDALSLFFNLKKVSDFGGQIPSSMVEAYIGKWHKMAIPEGTFDSLDKKSEMTEEQKKIKELVEKSSFMKDIKYKGTKKIMGTESYEYSANLDKEALKNFAIELAKLDSETPDLTADQIAEMDEQLKLIDLSGTFYVGVEDKIMRGGNGVLTLKPQGGVVKLDFKLEIGDINKEFKVEVPADAVEFDPMMLMGGGAMMDPSMMNPSMYEDMNYDEYVDASDYEPYEYEAEMLEIE